MRRYANDLRHHESDVSGKGADSDRHGQDIRSTIFRRSGVSDAVVDTRECHRGDTRACSSTYNHARSAAAIRVPPILFYKGRIAMVDGTKMGLL
jgi:hypothetical protein